jgi:hypothetical protein
MSTSTSTGTRFAYQDPAALAWTAQMFRTAHRRRIARLAAEEAQLQAELQADEPEERGAHG